MAYQKIFKCDVLTPGGAAVSTEAVSVIMPLVDGMLGVLADRAALIAEVGAGSLTIERPGEKSATYFVAGGFANVRDNAMTLLAEECQAVEKMDPAKATELLQQAESLPAETDAQKLRRRKAVAVASARLKVANSRPE